MLYYNIYSKTDTSSTNLYDKDIIKVKKEKSENKLLFIQPHIFLQLENRKLLSLTQLIQSLPNTAVVRRSAIDSQFQLHGIVQVGHLVGACEDSPE